MTPDSSRPLRGLRLAFVSRQHPYLGKSGSGTYIAAIFEGLIAAGARVRLILLEPPDEARTPAWWHDPAPALPGLSVRIADRLTLGRWHCQSQRRIPGYNRLARLLDGTPPSPPADWDSPATPSEAAFTGRQLKRFRPHAVIVNYSWLALLARHIPKSLPPRGFFLLAHDVRHLECLLADDGMRFNERPYYPRSRETAELQFVDTIIAIQSREAGFFQEMVPGKNVLVTTLPQTAVPHVSPNRKPGRCLLVGSNNSVNAAGARWLLEHAWSSIRAAVPGAELHVCGNLSENAVFVNPPAGVILRGRVDDLASEYASAAVVVAPLLSGSGLKIKMAEALAHGAAVVGTAIAFDGITPRPPVLQARNTPGDFARQVVHLLTDDAARQDAEYAARQLALQNFSREAALGPLISQLRTLIP